MGTGGRRGRGRYVNGARGTAVLMSRACTRGGGGGGDSGRGVTGVCGYLVVRRVVAVEQVLEKRFHDVRRGGCSAELNR